MVEVTDVSDADCTAYNTFIEEDQFEDTRSTIESSNGVALAVFAKTDLPPKVPNQWEKQPNENKSPVSFEYQYKDGRHIPIGAQKSGF